VNEVGAFGAVHRAAAAQTQDQVRLKVAGREDGMADVNGRRIFPDAIENAYRDVGGIKRTHRPLDMPGIANAGVGYQQHTPRALGPADVADAPQISRPETDANR